MRSIRTILAAVLASTALVAVGLSTESADAASTKDLNIFPGTKVIKKEQYYPYGRLKTHVARKVILQQKSGKTWKKVTEQTSTPQGYFEFELRMGSKSRTLRYYAPKTTIGGTTYAAVKGNSTTVKRARQTGSVVISPTAVCSLVPSATFTAIAKVSPPRPGRQITFSSPDGVEVTEYQDPQGTVGATFDVAITPGKHTIKAVVEARYGAPAKTVSTTYVAAEKYCLK